jgi:hypothetical protein
MKLKPIIKCLLNEYSLYIKSGSKSTDRILGYNDKGIIMSILLSDFILFLSNRPTIKATAYEEKDVKNFTSSIDTVDRKEIIDIVKSTK